jgi:hypothetical protein
MFSTHTTFLLKYCVVPQCRQDAFRAQMHISERYAKCKLKGHKDKYNCLAIHCFETQLSSLVPLVNTMHVVLRFTK